MTPENHTDVTRFQIARESHIILKDSERVRWKVDEIPESYVPLLGWAKPICLPPSWELGYLSFFFNRKCQGLLYFTFLAQGTIQGGIKAGTQKSQFQLSKLKIHTKNSTAYVITQYPETKIFYCSDHFPIGFFRRNNVLRKYENLVSQNPFPQDSFKE